MKTCELDDSRDKTTQTGAIDTRRETEDDSDLRGMKTCEEETRREAKASARLDKIRHKTTQTDKEETRCEKEDDYDIRGRDNEYLRRRDSA